MIGKRVLVSFSSNMGGELSRDKEKVYPIVAVYRDGRVKVSSGDCWRVRRRQGVNYDYEALD